MNRQERRLARRSAGDGDAALDDELDLAAEAAGAEAAPGGAAVLERRATRTAGPAVDRQRGGVRNYLHEVNVEMRKVAWPTRTETINYASVVLVTLAVLMALIFGLDLGFAKVATYLFK